jgi:hypothetical protein
MDKQDSNMSSRYGPVALVLVAAFIFGLSVSRLLYEGFFPALNWLGSPIAALVVGIIFALVGWLSWRRLEVSLQRPLSPQIGEESDKALSSTIAAWTAAIVFLPFGLNLAYLFNRSVNLASSRFLFFCSLWLVLVFTCRLVVKRTTWRWLGVLLLLLALAPIYLVTLGQNVGTADTFEFQVVAPRLGIVHPTGYPLYLLLTKAFSFIPLGTIAWRINLATAVFALAAVILLYVLGWRLTRWSMPALLAAFLFGLTPTFWSQAVQAEVYSLHALIVVAALLLMREIGNWQIVPSIHKSAVDSVAQDQPPKQQAGSLASRQSSLDTFWLTLILAFILGLGLTNHLTTVILIPPAVLTIWFAYRAGVYQSSKIRGIAAIGIGLVAFLSPLILYAYLPIRWAAVNGEAMGMNRFIEWVIGGRFQGALQLTAWLNDATRYDIVGRLFADEWIFFWTILLIFVGAFYLILWQWRYGLIVLITWLGYVFYGLNYIVPDLSVFLIPAQIIMAIWWTVGLVAALDLIFPKPGVRRTFLLEALFILSGLVPLLVTAGNQTLDRINQIQLANVHWGQAVLDLPLDHEAAILADSDKFPPLFYLQQAEGIRPDLDIVILPDEATYRVELDSRLARGQTVYLARFLPGLESIYHLNSLGPLIEVNSNPQSSLSVQAVPTSINFGQIKLLGYEFLPESPYAVNESALALYWQADKKVDEVLQVYARWQTETENSLASIQHPANNAYPTVAWEPQEIVSDFHILSKPITDDAVKIQVALAPPFSDPDDLDWQTIAEVAAQFNERLPNADEIRIEAGAAFLDAANFKNQVRPQADFSVFLSGSADSPEQLSLALVEKGKSSEKQPSSEIEWHLAHALQPPGQIEDGLMLWTTQINTDLAIGEYELVVANPPSQSRCGWFSLANNECRLGLVEISGVPLAAGATSFADKIALVNIDLPETALQAGGRLPVQLTWQALTQIEEDYTVFLQILDSDDKILGQIDSWPQQGTFPTSHWQPGELVEDSYSIPINEELAPGPYELHVGFYLLENLRRLPIVDENGQTVNDKVVVPGLGSIE